MVEVNQILRDTRASGYIMCVKISAGGEHCCMIVTFWLFIHLS